MSFSLDYFKRLYSKKRFFDIILCDANNCVKVNVEY